MKHTALLCWGLIAGAMAMDLAVAAPPEVAAAPKYATAPPLPLFAGHSVVQLKLRTDFSKLLGKRYGYGTDKLARQFQPVDLELLGDEAGQFSLKTTAMVSGRGALRGNECPFPQLKIDFEKRPGKNSFFRGLKELKMVTYCGASVTGRRFEYNEMIRMEYLIYRLRQEAADLSFHARLLQVTYEDTSGTLAPFQSYAIFVEDISDLAKRLNLDRVYNPKQVEARPELANLILPNVTKVDPIRRAELQLFQMMIGNHDYHWGHNLKGVFGPYGFDLVPYDFDYAEIFANPMHFNQLYLDYTPFTCISASDVRRVIQDLSRRRERLMKIVAQTDLVSPETKDMTIQSLTRFFRSLDEIQVQERDHQAEACPSDQ